MSRYHPCPLSLGDAAHLALISSSPSAFTLVLSPIKRSRGLYRRRPYGVCLSFALAWLAYPAAGKRSKRGRDSELAYLRACVTDNVGSVRRILRTKHYLLFSLIGETAVAVIVKRDLIRIIFFFFSSNSFGFVVRCGTVNARSRGLRVILVAAC